jgi:hypothetical protein
VPSVLMHRLYERQVATIDFFVPFMTLVVRNLHKLRDIDVHIEIMMVIFARS